MAEISTSLRSSKINSATRKVLAAIFVVVLIAATILGGIQLTGSDSSKLPTVSAAAGQTPTISKPEGTPPAELKTEDVIVGTGAEVLPTSTLTVHYVLMTWSD